MTVILQETGFEPAFSGHEPDGLAITPLLLEK